LSAFVDGIIDSVLLYYCIVDETRRILLSPFISKASRRVSSFFLSVQLSEPYVATGHTSAFISRYAVTFPYFLQWNSVVRSYTHRLL